MRILVSYLNLTNEIFSSLFKVNKHNSKNTNKFATVNTQEYSKCRLCVDGNITVNHIMSEYCILVQKEYKCTFDWVVKVIHWELSFIEKDFHLIFTRSNYRHKIKSADCNKLIFIEEDFCKNGHNSNRDTKFNIIKRIEKMHWTISVKTQKDK